MGSEDRGRGGGYRQTLMHPIHQSESAHLVRTGQDILRARPWADWAGLFHDRMLQHVGREMKNLQPSALYNAPDFELLAPFIDAFEPATAEKGRMVGQSQRASTA